MSDGIAGLRSREASLTSGAASKRPSRRVRTAARAQTSEYVLSAREVEQRFGLDLMTAEVIRHGLVNATSQMAWNLTYAAFSAVVRDLQDFAVGLAAPWQPDSGLCLDLLAAAEGCPIHFFVFQYKARNNILEFGLEQLEPGDVLVYNDAFRGGSHVMDVGCAKPVFHDGEIIAFALSDAHWVDIGGPVPGGFSPAFARDMWSEGLRLSPRFLYRRGKRVKSTFDLFLDNTRIPELSINDLQAKAATLAVGERAVLRLVHKYGKETVANAMRYILDYGERRMRAAIAAIPDGDYVGEDFIDDDGVTSERHVVRAAIRVRRDRMEVDLSGSSRQAIGNINGQGSDIASAAFIALKAMILPKVPTNGGLFRPIELVLPPGSIVNALPPAANTQGHLCATTSLNTAIHQALAPALPEAAVGDDYDDCPTVAAAGLDTRGGTPVPFVCFQVPFGPFGGTATHDGLSYSLTILGNCLELSYEIEEEFYPLVVLRKEFVPDTAGAGKFRGGPAVRWDELFLVDVNLSAAFDRVRSGTRGVLGGQGGPSAYVGIVAPERWDVRKTGKAIPVVAGRTPPSVMEIVSGLVGTDGALDCASGRFLTGKWSNRHLPAGSVLVTQVAGAGGWGNPLERAIEDVRRDVMNELVSVERARTVYGAVIDPRTHEARRHATAKRRKRSGGPRLG